MSLDGYGPPPKLGEFSRNPEPAADEPGAGPARLSAPWPGGAWVPGDSLCSVCVHAPVCAVAASIRLIGGEGAIVVSACPAFESLAPGEAPEPGA